MGTGSFPRVESGRVVTLTPHSVLVPRSEKQSRAIPLLSLRAFVACEKGETHLKPALPKIIYNFFIYITNQQTEPSHFNCEAFVNKFRA
jgi:hypothetical protein